MTTKLERKYQTKAERFRRADPSLFRWTVKFRKEQGRDLSFSLFPFQLEMHDAFGDRDQRHVCVMKSGQCGISALGVSLALFAGDVWGANVLYVLPTGDDAYDFSDTRVKPAIEDSFYLRTRVASTDNKGLKRIADANVYFRGSVSPRRGLSIPADVLIFDEYDRLAQINIPIFRKRLGSPTSLKLERSFSNPSFPEFGVHSLYLESDQRSWLVQHACGHEAPIVYDEDDDTHHVDEERALRVCGRCHRPLSREEIATGRWVAARPSVENRGYQISKLIVPTQEIDELVAEHSKTDEESITAHYNFDLGLPYAAKGGSLSEALVLACRRDWALKQSYEGSDWVTAGVDVGRVLHVRISSWLPSGRAVPLWIGEVNSFTDLAQIWDRYGVNFGLIDERPEERAARKFCESYRGRAMLLRWSGSDQRDPIVVDDDNLLVIARRTGALDRTIDAFTNQMRLLPRDLPPRYLKQVTAPHRVTETNSQGQKVARYVSERPDHFMFAECHDLLAKEARGAAAAEGGSRGPIASGGQNQAKPKSRWR